jgi:hypothetical protein
LLTPRATQETRSTVLGVALPPWQTDPDHTAGSLHARRSRCPFRRAPPASSRRHSLSFLGIPTGGKRIQTSFSISCGQSRRRRSMSTPASHDLLTARRPMQMHRRCRAAALVRSLMALHGAQPCRRSARPELPPEPRISREDVIRRAQTGDHRWHLRNIGPVLPDTPTSHRLASERRPNPRQIRSRAFQPHG